MAASESIWPRRDFQNSYTLVMARPLAHALAVSASGSSLGCWGFWLAPWLLGLLADALAVRDVYNKSEGGPVCVRVVRQCSDDGNVDRVTEG